MVYEERNTWVGLVVSVIGMAVYVIVVLQQAGGGPLTDVVWWPIMLWTIVGSIIASIVISILWGILAGMRDPDLAIYANEVTTAARIELLPFLHEQSITITAHRFGNPDAWSESVI